MGIAGYRAPKIKILYNGVDKTDKIPKDMTTAYQKGDISMLGGLPKQGRTKVTQADF